jgi:hypothetical protein
MSRKPQFEHKIPRFSENLEGLESALRQRPAPSYNAAIVACVYVAGSVHPWIDGTLDAWRGQTRWS